MLLTKTEGELRIEGHEVVDWGRILDFFGLRSRLVLHAVSGLTNQPGLPACS